MALCLHRALGVPLLGPRPLPAGPCLGRTQNTERWLHRAAVPSRSLPRQPRVGISLKAAYTSTDATEAWLWETRTFSDVTLVVYPSGGGPDAARTTGKPEPVAKLALHASVLSSVSPAHYRPQLTQLWQAKAVSSGAPVPLECSPMQAPGAAAGEQYIICVPATEATADAIVLELTCVLGEPTTTPEAVMRHAYSGVLPDEAPMLAWVMWRADQLGMPATVAASQLKLQAMAEGGKPTVQDLLNISNLPAFSQPSGRAAVQQLLAQLAHKVLPAHLSVAHLLLQGKQLRQLFLQLPFQLIKQWATMNSLQVDSNNTMAVLITAWYDHQLSSNPPAKQPTEQQRRELSALICLDKLSPSFHLQALPHLKWYRPPAGLSEQHAVLRVLAGLNTGLITAAQNAALASGGVARADHQMTYRLHTPFSDESVELVWSTGSVEGGSVCYGGYVLTPRLELKKSSAGLAHGRLPLYTLALRLKVSWPLELINHGVSDKVPHPVATVCVAYQTGDVVGGPCCQGSGVVPLSQDWSEELALGGMTIGSLQELLLVLVSNRSKLAALHLVYVEMW